MTAKFDAFKAALHALCVEHGVRLHDGCDYDDYGFYVDDGGLPGLDISLEDQTRMSEAERVEESKRREEAHERWQADIAARRAAEDARFADAIASGDLQRLQLAIAAEAAEQRKKNMRVTRIPGDHHDIGDCPCNVYLNEVPVADWIVADDFRRVVETPDGARFGSVRIDMQPKTDKPAEEAATHLCGMFVVEPKPEAPAIDIVEAEKPAPVATKAPAPKRNRRKK